MKNGTVTLEDNLVFSNKATCELTVCGRSSALRNINNSELCPHQNLYTYIYSSYVHSNTELETTQWPTKVMG